MKRFLITTFVIAAAMALLFVWLPPELKAGLRYATPASPPPQLPEAATPEPTPAPTLSLKCPDGSAPTITSADENGIHYTCGKPDKDGRIHEGVYLKW